MSVANVKVSERGEIVLPAESLRRWGLGSGGEVEIADLGDALLVVPAERGGLRSMVRVAVDDAGEIGRAHV